MLSEFGYTNDIQETPSQVHWERKVGFSNSSSVRFDVSAHGLCTGSPEEFSLILRASRAGRLASISIRKVRRVEVYSGPYSE